jgi:low temperature requirement protein LtrA
MSDIIPYAVYALCKFAAYAAWCYVGIWWFASDRKPILKNALLFGFGRLILGILLGIGIFLAALSMNNATRNAFLTYLVIYVPVRIGEWLLWYFLIRTESGRGRHLAWIVGGVLVSCLADIPLGIMEGRVVPVGRPFCSLTPGVLAEIYSVATGLHTL